MTVRVGFISTRETKKISRAFGAETVSLRDPHSLQVSKRLAASQFVEQTRPDSLPGDDIGWILLMPLDAVIELRALRIRQRQCGFQALPHHIQQFGFFG